MAGTQGIFGICLLFARVRMTSGITVNIPDEVYKTVRGDNAVIPCTFTQSSTITSVSWTAQSDVEGEAEINIVTYFTTGSKIKVYSKYKGRANIEVDLVKGTANLQLQSTTSADTRNYECKVQDTEDETGLLSDTAKLVVLVAPSPPVCKVVGKAEYFENIQLTCLSEEGTPTPTYKWQSYNTQNTLRPLPLKATDQNGLLSLVNISMDTSGYYICTSTNEIRSATCNVTLAVMPPSMNLGSTPWIIAGVALAAVVVIIIIICCCRHRRRKQAEEYAMRNYEGEEFTDKDPEGREEGHDEHVNYEEERRVKSADKRDPPDDRSERSYDRRSDYDERRDHNTDRRDDRSDRRERYDRDERRDRYDDDRRDRYDDRRDRRDNYDDRRDRYDDRRDRYDDRRDRYDDRYDSDRYSDRYDSRDRPPSVPPNKPREPRS